MTYYKILYGLQSCHGGLYTWEQFKRTPYRRVRPCNSGWHFCEKKDIVDWSNYGHTVYEVIPTKNRKIVKVGNKSVCSSVTLGKKIGTFTHKVVLEINKKALVFAIRQFAKATVRNRISATEKETFLLIADIIDGKGRLRDKIRKIYALRDRCSFHRYRGIITNIKYSTSKCNISLRANVFYQNCVTRAYNANLILKTLREKGNV